MAATRDARVERLYSVCDTASLLYNRMMENMGYGHERLKDIVEKEAKEEPAVAKEEDEEAKEQRQARAAVKEQQQDDDERYDTVANIKLVYKGKHVREFRKTGNLNNSNIKTIMANITSYTDMRVKVIYSFKSVIY